MFAMLFLECMEILQDVDSSWYVRRFLAIKDYPEKCPNCKILGNELYYFRLDPINSSLVKDPNE